MRARTHTYTHTHTHTPTKSYLHPPTTVHSYYHALTTTSDHTPYTHTHTHTHTRTRTPPEAWEKHNTVATLCTGHSSIWKIALILSPPLPAQRSVPSSRVLCNR